MSLQDKACDACGQPLEPVFDYIKRRDDYPQFVDALVIKISGGYGMYFDGPATQMVICKADADRLFMYNPWIQKFMNIYAGNVK
jgi:hypothetical protein